MADQDKPAVVLEVGGRDYSGWKSVRISRGIEQIAGGFELSVSEMWPGQDPARDRVQIHGGDACVLKLHDQKVITGFVDEVRVAVSASSHEVTISGRDATGDLVDCSAIHGGRPEETPKSGQWVNATMQQIATDLCKPYKVSVRTDTEVGIDTSKRLRSWSIQQGESVFSCLEGLAQHMGVLLISDGGGGLVITRAGTDRAGLLVLDKERSNILSAEASLSLRDRYSRYIAIASGTAFNDGSGPAAWVNKKQIVTDATMAALRDRPLVIFHDSYDQDGVFKLKEFAQWQANVHAGRSVDVTVKVQGWTQSPKPGEGALWQPNHISHVVSPLLRLDADMLIKRVLFTLDEQGTITELSLTDPNAFKLIPMPRNVDNWLSIARAGSKPALPEQLSGPGL